jgi:hypothetical protein
MDVTVTGGSGGIPSDGSVTAVVMNVTVVNPTKASFLTLYPTGAVRPTASNLNFVANQVVPNLVEVPVGRNGQVTVFNLQGTVDVVFDLAGYYNKTLDGNNGLYRAVAPARLMDTRSTRGSCDGGNPCARIPAGGSRNLQVTGSKDITTGADSGIPAKGVAAVVLNATVVNPTHASFLTLYPSYAPRPLASNVNFTAGQVVPNRVVVQVGSNGGVTIYNSQGSTDVVIDVAGYYTDTTATESTGGFAPLVPARLMDTRAFGGACSGGTSCVPMRAHTSQTLKVAGARDITTNAPSGVPATGASAVVLNVTVTNPTNDSFVTVFPGSSRPVASDLNFVPNQTVPNLVIVKLAPDGTVTLYNDQGTVDLVVDVEGWFS